MMPASLFHVLFAGMVVTTLLSACAGSQQPGRQASAAQKAACRQRADEVYAKQNRAELYNADTYASDTRDSPFGNAGLPGITTRGLGGQYARDNLVSDCLNDAAGNVGNTGYDAPAPASQPATPGRLPKSLSPLAAPPSP